MRSTVLVWACLWAGLAPGAVYQCDDGHGGKVFADRPCGDGAREMDLRYRPSGSLPRREAVAVDPLAAERARLARERAALETERARLAAQPPAAETGQRALSTREQRRLANKKEVARGMSEEWVRRSWGDPDRSFRRFNNDGSVTQEYVYEESGIGHPDRRVYLRNGTVVDLFDPTKKVR